MGVGGYLGVWGTSSLPVCFLPLSFLPLEKWNKFFSLDTFQLFFLEDTIKKNRGKLEQREVWDGPSLDIGFKEVQHTRVHIHTNKHEHTGTCMLLCAPRDAEMQ